VKRVDCKRQQMKMSSISNQLSSAGGLAKYDLLSEKNQCQVFKRTKRISRFEAVNQRPSKQQQSSLLLFRITAQWTRLPVEASRGATPLVLGAMLVVNTVAMGMFDGKNLIK
jgi:hypothetical protein